MKQFGRWTGHGGSTHRLHHKHMDREIWIIYLIVVLIAVAMLPFLVRVQYLNNFLAMCL